MKFIILGIHDNKSGHRSQLQGILENISIPNQVIQEEALISSIFGFLPNFWNIIISFVKMSEKIKIKARVKQNNFPNMIIAIGRRTFPVVRYYQKIAKRFAKELKVIYLMPPIKNSQKYFDLVFFHSYKSKLSTGNLIPITGAVHNITVEKLQQANKNSGLITKADKKPIISVLIGGKAKGVKITELVITDLVKIIKHIKQETNGSVFVSTSRRTGKKQEKLLKDQLQEFTNFFGYYENLKLCKNNPYLEMLAKSDYIIVSGESVSMISESCFAKQVKAVYIFTSNNFNAKRYNKFHQNLYDKGYAFPVEEFDCNKVSGKFDVKGIVLANIYKLIN